MELLPPDLVRVLFNENLVTVVIVLKNLCFTVATLYAIRSLWRYVQFRWSLSKSRRSMFERLSKLKVCTRYMRSISRFN